VPIVGRATGGGFASPVWGEFMRRVYFGDLPQGESGTDDGAGARPLLAVPDPWPVPAGLISRRVDSKTGTLASRWCPADEAYDELYLPGTEPTEVCDRQARSDLPGRDP